MELQNLSEEILSCIDQLRAGQDAMRHIAQFKAEAEAKYDMEIAKTLVGLKNGMNYVLDDGFEIVNPPASIMEKVARGICWKAKLELSQADAEWTRIRLKMDSIMASMNALQSLKRSLDVV